MTKQLQHITDLAEILFAHGIEDIVISPGSRNAPLIKAFYNRFGDKCKSLVDERSAAYNALGRSLITQKPTVLISTSGTAVLNYSPAIAEAFYQGIPLIVITADRPPEWIGQQDNQAIRQEKIYNNYIKASYNLPVESSNPDDLWLSQRLINQAFFKTVSENPGPVHINIPLREPLYDDLPKASKKIQVIQKEESENALAESSDFRREWGKAGSIMLVCGQLSPDEKTQQVIKKLSSDSRVVVVAEAVSNVYEFATIANPEVTLNSKIVYPDVALPELVIYFGGQVISKKIKLFLRGLHHSKFWFISLDEQLIDTFQNINSFIQADPILLFNKLDVQSTGTSNAFKTFWKKEKQNAEILARKYTKKIGFSDLQVFKNISEMLPENTSIFAGNSSVVRYLFYFDQKQRKFYSNRGVSGIDGCISTAAGLASKVDELVFAVVGDLTFTYDSNALWNRELPKNLKLILINNEGGGIFHLLKGPSEHEAFLPLVNAHHPVDFKKLSEAFGLNYILCDAENELQTSIQELKKESNKAEILEIRTPNNGEPKITKDFFKFLNKNYGTEMDNA